MIKNWFVSQCHRISMVSAALFGFGLAVGNLVLGGVCLVAALVLDVIYCNMSINN